MRPRLSAEISGLRFLSHVMKESPDMSAPLNTQTALIYVMVLMSAADQDMTDIELYTIGETIKMLPVFSGFDQNLLVPAAEDCASIMGQDEGLETVLSLVSEGLVKRYHETAYALACDVAASDGTVGQEELQLLEMLRHSLGIERLHAAAIECGARARYLPA